MIPEKGMRLHQIGSFALSMATNSNRIEFLWFADNINDMNNDQQRLNFSFLVEEVLRWQMLKIFRNGLHAF